MDARLDLPQGTLDLLILKALSSNGGPMATRFRAPAAR
jgi:hypothetical protein